VHSYGKVAREVPPAPAHHEHLSPWPLFLALGIMLLYYGVIFKGPVLGIAVILVLAALYGWVYEDYTTWRRAPQHAEEELPDDASLMRKWMAKPVAWWGVILFLLTEIMLFGGLFVVYFTAHASSPVWPPASAPELPVFATGINTAILVSSGVTMHVGIMFLKRNYRTAFLVLFAATIALGALFLFNQVAEYIELFGEGFNLSSGVYGASFFALTGVHGAHVTAGIGGLTGVFTRGLFGQFNAKRHTGIEGVALYWHFVDFVWIFLYLVIYVRVV